MRTVSHSGMVEAANDGASERSAACWISVRLKTEHHGVDGQGRGGGWC